MAFEKYKPRGLFSEFYGIRWPVSPERIAGSVSTHWGRDFLSVNKLLVSKWSQVQVDFFLKIQMKYVVCMSLWPRTIKILVSNWPRTRKFSQLFKITGVGDLFLPWLRSTSHFYALIGHNVTGEFMLMQHLETCLLWQLKPTEFCVNLWCSTGCTKWAAAAIKSLLLFMAGLFFGFLVEKCVACQSWKSDFGWHRFRFSPCLMRNFEGLKVKGFWPYLIAFMRCISNGKPE